MNPIPSKEPTAMRQATDAIRRLGQSFARAGDALEPIQRRVAQDIAEERRLRRVRARFAVLRERVERQFAARRQPPPVPWLTPGHWSYTAAQWAVLVLSALVLAGLVYLQFQAQHNVKVGG